jgi:hypothetical protein
VSYVVCVYNALTGDEEPSGTGQTYSTRILRGESPSPVKRATVLQVVDGKTGAEGD